MLLAIWQETVPILGCTVEQFIIGIICLFLASAFAFWFWGKLKGAAS